MIGEPYRRCVVSPRRAAAGFARGFTLIELLVTLVILSALAGLTVPVVQIQIQRIKEQELRLALREIRGAIDQYRLAVEEGRILRIVGASGYPPDLQTLVDGVEDQRDPRRRKIYFLRRIPQDPFSASDGRSAAATWALRSYASEADDPKAGDDVYDVMSRSQLVGLNGVPLAKW